MRAGKLIVTYDLLAQMLKLPGGNQVAFVSQDDTRRMHGAFEVVIMGDDCPKVGEGQEIPIVTLPNLKMP